MVDSQGEEKVGHRAFYTGICAVVLVCVVSQFVLTFRHDEMFVGQSVTDPNMLHRTHFNCLPCEYAINSSNNGGLAIIMNTTRGGGRTGNYIHAVWKAFQLAHACKRPLVLPHKDDRAQLYTSHHYRFDFTTRGGATTPGCPQSDLVGDSGYFFRLKMLQSWSNGDDSENVILINCFRLYLNICNHFCDGLRELHDVLVMHVRQGDIYPANFSNATHHGYGQPPLAYYMAAMAHQRWRKILVVAEQKNPGPTYQALQVINQTNIRRVEFQRGSWLDDFRTLLCASNVVASASTLHHTISFGFARNFFTYKACPSLLKVPGRIYYSMRIAPYRGWRDGRHDNSPQEWVENLLHRALPFIQCKFTPPSTTEVGSVMRIWGCMDMGGGACVCTQGLQGWLRNVRPDSGSTTAGLTRLARVGPAEAPAGTSGGHALMPSWSEY